MTVATAVKADTATKALAVVKVEGAAGGAAGGAVVGAVVGSSVGTVVDNEDNEVKGGKVEVCVAERGSAMLISHLSFLSGCMDTLVPPEHFGLYRITTTEASSNRSKTHSMASMATRTATTTSPLATSKAVGQVTRKGEKTPASLPSAASPPPVIKARCSRERRRKIRVVDGGEETVTTTLHGALDSGRIGITSARAYVTLSYRI